MAFKPTAWGQFECYILPIWLFPCKHVLHEHVADMYTAILPTDNHVLHEHVADMYTAILPTDNLSIVSRLQRKHKF